MENSFFIFNLGHGILPQTPVENVFKLIQDCENGRDIKKLLKEVNYFYLQ